MKLINLKKVKDPDVYNLLSTNSGKILLYK